MEIRKISPSEFTDALKVQSIAFNMGTDFSKGTQENTDYENILAAFDSTGKLCSCMELIPFEAWLNGRIVKMSGIGGVATLPEERCKGYVKALFGKAFEDARNRRQCLSYLFPFSHPYYRKFGYEYCDFSLQTKIPMSAFRGFSADGAVTQYFPGAGCQEIIDIYDKFASGTNFMIRRSREAWNKKLKPDPFINKRYIYVWHDRNGKAESYVILKAVEEKRQNLEAEELIWTDAESLRGIFAFLKTVSTEYEHISWLAPEFLNLRLLFDEPYGIETSGNCWGMCRIVDLTQALLTLPVPGGAGNVTLEIRDKNIPSNDGIFTFSWDGPRSEVVRGGASPDLACGIETAAQLISGFSTPEELEFSGKAEIRSKKELLSQLFKRRKVFIRDTF